MPSAWKMDMSCVYVLEYNVHWADNAENIPGLFAILTALQPNDDCRNSRTYTHTHTHEIYRL